MLISEEHRSSETKKHISDPDYGGEAIQYADHISTMINAMQIDDVPGRVSCTGIWRLTMR